MLSDRTILESVGPIELGHPVVDRIDENRPQAANLCGLDRTEECILQKSSPNAFALLLPMDRPARKKHDRNWPMRRHPFRDLVIHCEYERGAPMPSTVRERKSKRLNFRISDAQEELLRRGAVARKQSVTDFIVESACAVAECELAVQSEFKLPPQQWHDFLAALDQPAYANPALHRLLTAPSILDPSPSK